MASCLNWTIADCNIDPVARLQCGRSSVAVLVFSPGLRAWASFLAGLASREDKPLRMSDNDGLCSVVRAQAQAGDRRAGPMLRHVHRGQGQAAGGRSLRDVHPRRRRSVSRPSGTRTAPPLSRTSPRRCCAPRSWTRTGSQGELGGDRNTDRRSVAARIGLTSPCLLSPQQLVMHKHAAAGRRARGDSC